ncbi:serine/threonine-protein kinase [Pseudorhodoferax sp. Leaf267]|uniref:serine/threonine protein kinase n=1 Tax=Pseudorhodoferax sp. Leaf267 TaxID=1736316 RepID=UPI0007130C15|nr:serine/threonine-protein kinase [Pseudorhodoferax sp. Leaf267]KQP19243.1 hypothetical protein ASF43_29075 [Pseudorhodoferax sp. Leaf267]
MAAIPALPADPVLHHRDALPVGTRLAEFELQALLGVGGFGVVYRAYDHSLHRMVAIKEYMPSVLAGRVGTAVAVRASVDQALFASGLRSFLAEARLLAQFDHPSLVKVFRVWEQNDTAYIVMPFYQGMTLKQARAQMRHPPPEAWLRKLLWSLLEALEVLHLHDMVHRDLSPDNIFLQDVGPPVLLDLGAARRAIGEQTQRHTAILKVNYAPIEQYAEAEDLRQGPWSDLYALAAVVHGCLSSALPVPATFRVLRDRLPPLAEVVASLQAQSGQGYSAAFVQGLTQALAVQPAERPQSVAAFADLLQLAPPPAMDRFDWRMELGSVWQPAHEAPVPASQPLHADEQATLRLDPVTLAAARALHAEQATVRIQPAAVATAPARRGPAFWGLAIGLLGCVLAGAIVLSPASAPEPAPPAATPVQAAAQPASAPVSGSAPVQTQTTRAPGATEATRPAPRPPARALRAEDICPDSNFLTRPMCLHRECQKPRYARAPVCVENARRLRDSGRQDGT